MTGASSTPSACTEASASERVTAHVGQALSITFPFQSCTALHRVAVTSVCMGTVVAIASWVLLTVATHGVVMPYVVSAAFGSGVSGAGILYGNMMRLNQQ